VKFNKIFIIGISFLVPSVVALLFVFTTSEANIGSWVHTLPVLNVSINSATILILLLALLMIMKGKETVHRNLMLLALALGTIFLVSYITYHASVPSTVFGDTNHDGILSDSELTAVGNMRLVYLILLLAHILIAIIGLPLVLLAVFHGIKGNRRAHKKIVKVTYPVWMFIAISGVAVYFLISPYY
jgi:putative membrane protein